MFVDVILPLSLAGSFTYEISSDLVVSPKPGMRVVVPFGKKKLYTGIIYFIHSQRPQVSYEVKQVVCFLDETPIVTNIQLKLWEWVAEYYMCHLGDVYRVALPNALKLESETQVILSPHYSQEECLQPPLQRIVDILIDGKIYGLSELSKRLDTKKLLPSLNKLMEMGVVHLNEKLANKYVPKVVEYVSLHPAVTNSEQLQHIFDGLSRANKQLKLLMYYLDMSDYLQTNQAREVRKVDLLEKADATSVLLKSLVDKQVLTLTKRRVDRLETYTKTREALELSQVQREAYSEIRRSWTTNQVTLLHGVTSSGKTEIYTQLINDTLSEGKQVLFLVPEIALTTQLADRLKGIFGEELGVYHSKYSAAERVEIYDNLRHNKSYNLILGARSAVFLPFRQLGLIIVDEEHDTSYKQQDAVPCYNGRNTAIVLATMHHAKVLLGTATPSVESYYNAQTGKYGLVKLTQRYQNIEMPEILLVDTKEAYRKKLMTGYFSDELIELVRTTLLAKEQIIVFQNRRGYAPYVECKACNSVPHCTNCDVSLTLHKRQNMLVCHYCGHAEKYVEKCQVCQTGEVKDRGLGTEKIEEEIKKLFPEARTARMDLDTTRNRNSYEKMIADFQRGSIDILVGTQMVTKGLNFDNVSLVAVLNADNLLNQPDFRAHERAFQMLEQVSGRAGRKHKQGRVVIQTSNVQSEVLRHVVAHDYDALYDSQVVERELFRYPPYFRMMHVEVKHRDLNKLLLAIELLAKNIKGIFGNRCSQIIEPLVSRTHNLYIRQLLLRVEINVSVVQAKSLLREQIHLLERNTQTKGCMCKIDVDPM